MTPIERSLVDRGPPLPWVYELAARTASEEPDALGTDPGAIARSLANAVDLFSLPAVCTSYDTALEYEAIRDSMGAVGGGPDAAYLDEERAQGVIATVDDALAVGEITDGGRIPMILDATARLADTVTDASVLGGLTGPARLTRSLLVDDADEDVREEVRFTAGDVAVDLANAYFDCGTDGVLVLEPDGVGDVGAYGEDVAPVLNVVDHYDGTAVLAVPRVDDGDIETAADCGFDAITGGVDAPGDALATADACGITLGVGVPDERFLADTVEAFVADLPPDALVSSCVTVPEDTAPGTLHGLMGSL